MPVSYIAPGEHTSPKFCRAFALGCGGEVQEHPALRGRGPVALFGSPKLWPLLKRAQRERREWWYGDHAYFGRGSHYRITRNAYQHDGRGESTAARFLRFRRPIYPWRSGGTHILICPQSAMYFSLFGLELEAWLNQVTSELKKHTDRPVRIRRKHDAKPIHADLVGCWAVVVYSSAAALDALIAGVPVFVMANFAAAYRMGTPDLSKIEKPFYPHDRRSFLSVLADHQWTLDEISQGVAWRTLTHVH